MSIFYTPKISHSKGQEKNLEMVTVDPLPKGMGNTLGNAIRRTLYRYVEGAAIVELRCAQIPHKFSTLTFCREDALQLYLNLKKIIFKPKSLDEQIVEVEVKISKEGDVSASEFAIDGLEVANPNLFIMHKTNSEEVVFHVKVAKGKYMFQHAPQKTTESDHVMHESGFSSSQHASEQQIIRFDTVLSPVLRANFKVERSSFSKQDMEFDKLILEVLTNGSVTTKFALLEAIAEIKNNLDKINDLIEHSLTE